MAAGREVLFALSLVTLFFFFGTENFSRKTWSFSENPSVVSALALASGVRE